MKTINRLFVLFSVLILASCDLDVLPPTGIPAETFWRNDKDAWYALNECYRNMPSFNIGDEMTTDNAHSHKPWEGNFELLQQNGIGTGATYGSYNFAAVRTANIFLANVDKCKMDDALKERMKNEARFFRALAYVRLTSYYGKVPIIKNPLPYDNPPLRRDPLEEVQKFILDELSDIATKLPESYAGGYLNENGRVTRYAAHALRARAALNFGNYQEAEKSAKAVIDGGKYSLFHIASLNEAQRKEANEMDMYIDFKTKGIDKEKFVLGMFSYESLWQSPNANPTNPEYILTKEFGPDATTVDESRYRYLIPMQMSIYQGYSSYEPMQDLIDAFWDIDGKTIRPKIDVATRKANYETLWKYAKDMDTKAYKAFSGSVSLMNFDYMKEFRNRDSRLYASYMFPFKGWHNSSIGEFYYKWDPDKPTKDGNESWTGFSYRKIVSIAPFNRTHSSDDYPVIRYAEVLLSFAEARTMVSGYDAEVRKALNQLRERCGMPEVPVSLTKDEAINLIRNERRIELSGEGQRYDDLRRYGSAYASSAMSGASTAPSGYVVVNKAWGDRLMLMPIPTSAIDKNPLLKDDQNLGW